MNSNERLYSAHTYSGGEETYLTLEQAREQVRVWEEKGYPAFVTKPSDPEWEDLLESVPAVGEVKEFSPAFVIASQPDRESAIDFAKQMLEALDCEVDHQDGYFVVYDLQEGA